MVYGLLTQPKICTRESCQHRATAPNSSSSSVFQEPILLEPQALWSPLPVSLMCPSSSKRMLQQEWKNNLLLSVVRAGENKHSKGWSDHPLAPRIQRKSYLSLLPVL